MMSWSMTEFEANSTHMVDSREKIAKLNWPMVRMAVPGTQGEWSAQSLLQSPETASVAIVAEYYLGLEAYSCDFIGKFCG